VGIQHQSAKARACGSACSDARCTRGGWISDEVGRIDVWTVPHVFPARGRRWRARAHGERATTFELFFELVYVFALTEVTDLMTRPLPV
jgi:hypothetical protein